MKIRLIISKFLLFSFIYIITCSFASIINDSTPTFNTPPNSGDASRILADVDHLFTNSSKRSHRLPLQNVKNNQKISYHHHQIQSFNCTALLNAVLSRRKACMSQSETEAEMMLYFTADYHHLMPYLIHYLSLGYTRIWIYNNDEENAWYHHPAFQCFFHHELIELQPWFGQSQLYSALQHWKTKVKEIRGLNDKTVTAAHNIWLSFIDVDELLLLHTHNCINTFLDNYPTAPEIMFNWALFIPEYPWSDFARTGKLQDMTEEHFAVINYNNYFHSQTSSSSVFSDADKNKNNAFNPLQNQPLPQSSQQQQHFIMLPQDMLIRRVKFHDHVKSITRLSCFDKIANEHYAFLTPSCPYGMKAYDPENRTQEPSYHTIYTEQSHQIAQLNHYWTISIDDYLRKIHRGLSGQTAHRTEEFRSMRELYTAAQRKPFIDDVKFLDTYKMYFGELKNACPLCFSLSLYYHNHNGRKQQQQ